MDTEPPEPREPRWGRVYALVLGGLAAFVLLGTILSVIYK
jgi:hypothetical protein